MTYLFTEETGETARLCAFLRNTLARGGVVNTLVIMDLIEQTERLISRNGALEGPNNATIILRLNEYQANNLAKFVSAIHDHPDTRLGDWDTGDWCGELASMLEELADKTSGGSPAHRPERS